MQICLRMGVRAVLSLGLERDQRGEILRDQSGTGTWEGTRG